LLCCGGGAKRKEGWKDRRTQHGGHGAQAGVHLLFVGAFDLETRDGLEADGVQLCGGTFGWHGCGLVEGRLGGDCGCALDGNGGFGRWRRLTG
jgi:hypothetical protein